jgi:hypothetical protein
MDLPKIPLTEEQKNMPWGRREMWLQRDDKIYCPFHPQIHPDNIEQIKYKSGGTEKEKDGVLETKTFEFCPKCFKLKGIKKIISHEKKD